MLKLTDLKPKHGARIRRKRVARGESSGMGKTAGRGTKGQQSRSGGGFYVGFEGGQNPLYKRVPKMRGFKNQLFTTRYTVVNVGELKDISDKVITLDLLKEKNIIRKNAVLLKVLGTGEYKGNATIKAHKFSAEAAEKIQKAGGKIELIKQYASDSKAAATSKKKSSLRK